MGFAICRFEQDKGCNAMGSQEWHIFFGDKYINVPSMWKHYMTGHLIQPTEEERQTIMNADPSGARGKLIQTRGAQLLLQQKILYVERIGKDQYTHEVGESPDFEFIEKLENILAEIRPLQTKGTSQVYR